jgi:hypothetical protein
VLLGLWLLSGFAKRAAWVAALAFFALAAAGSLYLAIEGQASCGCFGRVEVSPWWALLLDALVLAALFVWRPVLLGNAIARNPLPSFLKSALSAGVLVALVGGGFLLLSEDPAQSLARLRGDSLAITPPVTDVGEGPQGEQRTFTIQLTNNTMTPVRIVGGTTTCACIATSDLPLTIEPQQSQTLSIQIRFRGSPGRFQHRFDLYTDSDDKRWVRARFAGRVVAKSAT